MISPDHKKYLIGNYASPVLEIVRGEGAKLWDSEEREFLDFTSGIAVANLGTGYFAPESEKELTSLQMLAAHARWLVGLVQVALR